MNVTAEELEARRQRILTLAGQLDKSVIAHTTGDRGVGLRQIASTVSPEFRARIAERTAQAEARLEAIERERQEALELRRAGFTGDCITCFDEGCCVQCDRGRRAIAAVKDAEVMLARTAWLTRGQVPEAFRGWTLESYPGDARVTQKLNGFISQWDRRQWLVLTGQYGVGKTGLAVALLNRIAVDWQHRPIRFVTSVDLLNEIRESYSSQLPALVVKNYSHTNLLVLDDLGSEKPSDWVSEQLYGIINHRHSHNLPTIITTNYQLEDSSLMQRVGQRIFWRIYERAVFLNVTGVNLRLEQEGL